MDHLVENGFKYGADNVKKAIDIGGIAFSLIGNLSQQPEDSISDIVIIGDFRLDKRDPTEDEFVHPIDFDLAERSKAVLRKIAIAMSDDVKITVQEGIVPLAVIRSNNPAISNETILLWLDRSLKNQPDFSQEALTRSFHRNPVKAKSMQSDWTSRNKSSKILDIEVMRVLETIPRDEFPEINDQKLQEVLTRFMLEVDPKKNEMIRELGIAQ